MDLLRFLAIMIAIILALLFGLIGLMGYMLPKTGNPSQTVCSDVMMKRTWGAGIKCREDAKRRAAINAGAKE